MAKRTSKKSADRNVDIRIREFRLTKFIIGATSRRDDIEFKILTEVAKSATGDTVRIQFDITGDVVDATKRGDEPIVAISTQTYFDIALDDEASPMAREIPGDITATMLTVAYGTTRGVLFAKTVGTPIEGMLLPITTVHALITEATIPDNGHERGI